MKIDFANYDLSEFRVREVSFCGREALLINPNHICAKFNQRNKIFRSSIWTKHGELLSAGLPKFKNWGEDPSGFPKPKKNEIHKAIFTVKADGSLLILDKVDGQLNIRSRGTANASILDNGAEWPLILEKYPEVSEFMLANPEMSLLFEMVTPNNKIVLNYGENVDFYFIGAIEKADYSLATQRQLDIWADKLNLKRPGYHVFKDVDEIMEFVETNTDSEGFVIYHDGDRMTKIKTDWYRKVHALKSELSSFEKILDFYLVNGMRSYQETLQEITDTIDFEVSQQVAPMVSKICDAMKEVKAFESHARKFVESQPLTRTKKDIVMEIFEKWGQTNRGHMVISLLDGKDLGIKDYKKLLFQMSE